MALSDNLEDWLLVDEPSSDQPAPAVLVLDDGGEAAGHGEEGGPSQAGLPMKSRHIEAVVNASAGIAETCESLHFIAEKDCSATFRFPLPPKSAVRRVTAVIGTKTITTETKKKAEAERDYKEATEQGHTAVKVSQQSAQSIFELALGNLGANESAVIKIEYLQLLPKMGHLLEYTHTATWVPPYTGLHCQDKGTVSPLQAYKVSYTLSHSITVEGNKEMTTAAISSPTHDIQVHPAQPGKFTCRTTDEVSDASKDFQLAIELDTTAGSNIQLQTTKDDKTGEETSTLLAVFCPKGREVVGLKQEVMLVIDCSGSMGGAPEQQAKEAAMLFVRDLPTDKGICFNVVCFGSRFVEMWDTYKEYNEATEKEALQWLNLHVYANLGGTEMQAVMDHVYSKPIKTGWERQILLLTDGGVGSGQDQRLIDLVDSNGKHPTAARSHVFPLGIGNGVHRPLLDSVAEKSNGAARYVVDSSDIAKKMGWLSNAIRAKDRVHNLKLVTRGCVLRTTPKRLPTILWPGQPLTILATIMKAQPEASVELISEDAEGSATGIQLPVPQQPTSEGTVFKTLHAMSTISDLTSQMSQRSNQYGYRPRRSNISKPEDDETKEEIVRIACAEGLVTEYTTSVGVEARQDPLDPTKVTHHDIPLQAPAARQQASYEVELQQQAMRFQLMGQGIQMAHRAASFQAPAKKVNRSFFSNLFSVSSAAPRGGAPSPWSPCYAAPRSAAPRSPVMEGAPAPRSSAPRSSAPRSALQSISSPADDKDASGTFQRSSAALGKSKTGISPWGDSEVSPWGDSEVSPWGGSDISPRGASESTASPTRSEDGLKGSTKVQQLSNLRETQGYWKATASLFAIILGDHADGQARFEGIEPAPGGFSRDVKATVLALAWLMKRQRNEQAVWQGIWDKAITWLQANGGAAFGNETAAAEKIVAAARQYV